MIKLKDNVRIKQMTYNVICLFDVLETFSNLYNTAVWITSGNDSRHCKGSDHYTGYGYDLRTRNLDVEQLYGLIYSLNDFQEVKYAQFESKGSVKFKINLKVLKG